MKGVMSRGFGLAVLLAAGLAVGAGSAGSVDTGFGVNGVAVYAGATANSDSNVWQVQGLADGRILAAGGGGSGTVFEGTESKAWHIRRLLADGSLDSTFGGTGLVRLYGDVPGTYAQARAALLDGQGRSLIAGRARFFVGTTGKGKKQRSVYEGGAVITRLLADGSVDTSYGVGGDVRLFPEMTNVSAMIATAAGDVLVVGSGAVESASSGTSTKGRGKNGGGSSSSQGIVIARLDAGGSLDTQYGVDGFARADLNPDGDDDGALLHGARLQSDGSLVLLANFVGYGAEGPRVGLLRFAADGTRDAAFPDPMPDAFIRSMAVDGQDRILLTGYSQDGLHVFRYDADGGVDGTFGSAGETVIDTTQAAFQTEPLGGRALHLDATGLYLCCIEWVDENQPVDGFHSFLIRLDGSGNVVSTFGSRGDGQSDRLLTMPARDAVVLPSGDIVFGGGSYASATLGDWAVGRICGQ